jgi:hypothetical protein
LKAHRGQFWQILDYGRFGGKVIEVHLKRMNLQPLLSGLLPATIS